MPTQIIHKVHIESYKKLLLINMIHTGKIISLPSTTPNSLRLKFENSLPNYRSLAQAYVQKNDKEFFDTIAQGFNEFEKDKNLGIVQKLQKMYNQKRICDLNFTYLTLRYKYSINPTTLTHLYIVRFPTLLRT